MDLQAVGLREGEQGLDNFNEIGERGVHLSSVIGGVELGVSNNLNAEFVADRVVGNVISDIPNIRIVTIVTDGRLTMKRGSVQADKGSLSRVLEAEFVFVNSPDDKSAPPPAIQLRSSFSDIEIVQRSKEMKNSAINRVCALLSVVLGASSVWASVEQDRDEINRRFTLPAKAHVEVSAINGSVDIKTIDGDTAIVEIERTARSRAELDCNRIVLKQAAGKLIIASVNEGGCGTIQVAHRMLLTLPRYVDVSVHGVSGPINIGEIEGALYLRGNSGSINLAQSGPRSRISGNQGTTTIKLRKLHPGGLELSGNSGPHQAVRRRRIKCRCESERN